MQENILLTIFAVLPLATGYLLFLFFRGKSRIRKQYSRWRTLIVGNILVLLFLLSLLVLIAKSYYRFLYDTTDSFGLTKTTKRWFKRYYQINKSGFRDNLPVYMIKPDPTKPRITFLGDSFTAGHGIKNVDDRFANQIRKMHPELEVHVFAKNGWDTRT